MKLLRNLSLIAIIAALFALTTAYAADRPVKHAAYNISFTYDNDRSELIGTVYLNNGVTLSAGSFGVIYDSTIINNADISFTLNEARFLPDGRENNHMEDGSNYKALSWISANEGGIAPGNNILGKLVISNVTEEQDENGNLTLHGWHNRTLLALDWLNDTTVAKNQFFSDTTDNMCYNSEIWRAVGAPPYTAALSLDSQLYYPNNDTETAADDISAAELEIPGYFQGLVFVNDYANAIMYEQWIDIDTIIDLSQYTLPNPPEKKTIVGKFWSYNKNNRPTVTLYHTDTGLEYSDPDYAVTYSYQCFDDGRVLTTYTMTGVAAGTYNLTVSKLAHLPYTVKNYVINKNDGNKERNLGDKYNYLYCGDINMDGKIKLNDNSNLVCMLGRRVTDRIQIYDLNGDGKISLHDLDILKTYYNKTYEGVG